MIHLTLVVRKDCDKLIQWYVGVPIPFYLYFPSPRVRRGGTSFCAPHRTLPNHRVALVCRRVTLTSQARQ